MLRAWKTLLVVLSLLIAIPAIAAAAPSTFDLTGSGVASTLAGAACEKTLSTSHDAPLGSGSLRVFETDCFTLTDVMPGDVVQFRTSPTHFSITVRNQAGTGAQLCGTGNTEQQELVCTLTGIGPFEVRVSGPSGSGTHPFNISALRLTRPEGCRSLGDPRDWVVGSPRINASTDRALQRHCFTFNRDDTDPVGTYWLRTVVSAGNMQAQWRVFSPTGTLECSSSSNGPAGFEPCTLRSRGQFVVVVNSTNVAGAGLFYLAALRLSGLSGCGEIESTSFSGPVTQGVLASGDDVDCFSLPTLNAGDLFEISTRPSSLAAAIIDADGASVCQATGNRTTCRATAGMQRLLVYDRTGTSASTSYSVTVRRLTDPEGCATLEHAQFAFGAARRNGSVSGVQQPACLKLTESQDAADTAYWLRAVGTSGASSVSWRLIDPTGAQRCSSSNVAYAACALRSAGEHLVLVDASAPTSFYLTAKWLTDPVGCTPITSSTSYNTPASRASLSGGDDIDCWQLPAFAAGERVDVSLLGGTDARWEIVDNHGSSRCSTTSANQQCTLDENLRLLVYSANGSSAFDYGLKLRSLTNPEGCAPLGEPDAFSFTAPRTNLIIDAAQQARCFTFTRVLGDPTVKLWLRAVRFSGAITPAWRIHDPYGGQVCSGTATGYNVCTLSGAGRYTIVVDDSTHAQTGTLYLTAKQVNGTAGCTPLPSLAFNTPAVRAAISSSDEIDCYTLPSVQIGDAIELTHAANTGSLTTVLINENNTSSCPSSNSTRATVRCTTNSDGQWKLLIYNGAGTTSSSYSLRAYNLTRPQGCVSLERDTWSFTGPRINGTFDSDLNKPCFTFTRLPTDPDEEYWFRTIRVGGNLSWRVLTPSSNGLSVCSQSNSDHDRCVLQTAGQHTLIVDESSDTPGDYHLIARKTTSPTGCADLPPLTFGFGPVHGNLTARGETDCYKLPVVTGDRMRFTTTGPADGVMVFTGAGRRICGPLTSSTCTISGNGPHILVVYPRSVTATGGYRLSAVCENEPCGQSETAVTHVVPQRVGAGKHTTAMVRGRDLELLDSVTLSRGSAVIEGDVQPAGGDGRGREVRFDLSGAGGAYRLDATFIDGSTRTLENAVTVEAPRRPDVRVQLIGRDVFRSGNSDTVTVQLHNAGNVDAIGVPVTLSGIPDGATVEPMFDLVKPRGNVDAPTFTPDEFDALQDLFTGPGGLAVPVFVPRVPAGGTVSLEYRILSPASSTNHTLRAIASPCLGSPPPRQAASTPVAEDAFPCVESTAKMVIGAIPFGSCFLAGYEIGGVISRGLINPLMGVRGEAVITLNNVLDFGQSVAGCALDAIGVGVVADAVYMAFSSGYSAAGAIDECWDLHTGASMDRRRVASFDPNDIIGPAGSGAERYITGDGTLSYKVLFENLPAATASAQRVRIENQLDVSTFDPSTVMFEGVAFGSTRYTLPYATPQIDHTIDLRPANDLLVRVKTDVTATGNITWDLQAIDPETLRSPEDPLAGFLPPNTSAPAGEGFVSYRVAARPLPAGALIPNQASIVFDDNQAIQTPTWTNRIDRDAPQPTVAVTTSGLSANVTWDGTDDAAGITSWDLRVSKDGGPYTLWTTATEPGAAVFTASEPGRYSFRADARDGAGNSGQSAAVGVNLAEGQTPTDPTPEPTPDPTPEPGPDPTPAPSPRDPGPGSDTPPPGTGIQPTTTVAAPTITAKSRLGRLTLPTNRRLRVPVRVTCPGAGPACTGTITITAGKRVIGRASFTITATKAAQLTVRVSAANRKRLTTRTTGTKIKVTVNVQRTATRATKTTTGSLRRGR